MFNPYALYPLFHDSKRSDLPYDWERLEHKRANASIAWDMDHYNDLFREAEQYRLIKRLPQQPSLATQLWLRVQDWVDELTCRVRGYAFRQPCPEPVG